jgi:hypothetical protein
VTPGWRQASTPSSAVQLELPCPERRKISSCGFFGDLFTFGIKLNEAQTFVAISCQARLRQCANLGRAGTGTVRHFASLEYFLRWDLLRTKTMADVTCYL